MNKETRAGFKAAVITALIGSFILIRINNPVAWAALVIATIKVGGIAYQNAKLDSSRRHDEQDRIT
tara:strand:+ start:13344 stop:13541 length:198 start_codon:yes stop_codon:yes gene_type:complete